MSESSEPPPAPDTQESEATFAASPEQVTDLVHAAIPVTGHLGLRVLEIRPGFVRLLMPFSPNRNHLGTMYAGSLVALAEIPGGLIPMSMPELAVVPIASGLQVEFLRAAHGDAFLSAQIDPQHLRELAAEAHRNGKAAFTLDTEVHNDAGDVLMTCRGNYQLRPVRS